MEAEIDSSHVNIRRDNSGRADYYIHTEKTSYNVYISFGIFVPYKSYVDTNVYVKRYDGTMLYFEVYLDGEELLEFKRELIKKCFQRKLN